MIANPLTIEIVFYGMCCIGADKDAFKNFVSIFIRAPSGRILREQGDCQTVKLFEIRLRKETQPAPARSCMSKTEGPRPWLVQDLAPPRHLILRPVRRP